MNLGNFIIDISQTNNRSVQSIQSDVNSRFVNATVVNNGKKVDLTGYLISLACKKPDGKIVFNETELVDAKQGVISFEISEQMTSTIGEVACEFKIYGKNGSVLTTQYFTINVSKPISGKNIQSSNEFRQLTIAMNEFNKWINNFDDKMQEITTEFDAKLAEETKKFESTFNAIETKFDRKYTSVANQFQNKYDGLEQEYATELTSVKNGLEQTNIELEKVNDEMFRFNIKPNNGDWFGFNSLNIVGDSISHGANVINQVNDSYIGILRKMFQIEFDTSNFGFEKINPTISNSSGTYKGYHEVINDSGWSYSENNNTIGLSSYHSYSNGAILKLRLTNITQSFLRLIYNGKEDGGRVIVYLDGFKDKGIVVDTTVSSSSNGMPLYSNIIEVSKCNEDGDVILCIEKIDNLITQIDGIQYFNNADDYMVQNYARSGVKLVDIDDSLIKMYASCNHAIFALGHNDIAFESDIESFSFKIDRFIHEYNKNNANVIVLDFGWHWTIEESQYKQHLKRLATETNGFYIDFNKIYRMSLNVSTNNFLSDYSHPSLYGHQCIAETTAKITRLGVSCKHGASKLTDDFKIKTFSGFNLISGGATINNGVVNVSIDFNGGYFNGDKILKLPLPKTGVNVLGFVRAERNGIVDYYSQSFFLDVDGILVAYPHQIINIQNTVLNFSYSIK